MKKGFFLAQRNLHYAGLGTDQENGVGAMNSWCNAELTGLDLVERPVMDSSNPQLRAVTAFFSEIGLAWQLQPGANGFVPGVEIEGGVLLLDPDASPSAALHEAGHLSCMPAEFRHLAQGDLKDVFCAMLDTLNDMDPDAPQAKAIIQCSDPEATAWAWAAGMHIGLPINQIILDDEYNGNGHVLRLQLQMRAYAGINGLANAGFCVTRPRLEDVTGLPAYPKLVRWLQKDFRTVELQKKPQGGKESPDSHSALDSSK